MLKTSTGFEIEDTIWFTDMGGISIGIVKGKSDHGERKYYIGAVTDPGLEDDDALEIAETGSKFTLPKGFWEK